MGGRWRRRQTCARRSTLDGSETFECTLVAGARVQRHRLVSRRTPTSARSPGFRSKTVASLVTAVPGRKAL